MYFKGENQITGIIDNLNFLKRDFIETGVDTAPLEAATEAIKQYIFLQSQRENDLTSGFLQWWANATGQDVIKLPPNAFSMIKGILTSA